MTSFTVNKYDLSFSLQNCNTTGSVTQVLYVSSLYNMHTNWFHLHGLSFVNYDIVSAAQSFTTCSSSDCLKDFLFKFSLVKNFGFFWVLNVQLFINASYCICLLPRRLRVGACASVSRRPSLAVATILVNYDGLIKQITPHPPFPKIYN